MQPMNALISKRWITVTIPFLLLIASACNGSPGSGPSSSQSSGVTVHENVTFGSGPFNLPDPKVGLSDLSSYSATLTMSFSGTQNGQAQQWSRKYVMLASRQPAVRQLTVVDAGSSGASQSVYMAELDGADYAVQGQNACTASAVKPGNSLSDVGEPAGYLPYVLGANEAGTSTVNNVPAKHYTFDQLALGQQDLTQSTGELWVASDGGYVVKYLLTAQAKADYFGAGTEGTLTWDYELAGIGKPVTIQLPASCPGGMVNAPLLQGASNVVNIPGTLSYDTSTSLTDAAAFYQKQVPALGWTLQNTAAVQATKAFMEFQQGGNDMTVFITAKAGVTTVNILLTRIQK